VAALFPQRGGLDTLERMLLSLGVSLMWVPLMGMGLNYTFGIRLPSIIISVTLFIAICCGIAWWRRRSLPVEERWVFTVEIPPWGQGWDKVLSLLLVLSILGAGGTMGYMILFPKIGEKFTEFYVLGPKGIASDYPWELSLGEEAQVTLGIINREMTEVSYKVEIRVEGEKVAEVKPVTLEHNQKWEKLVSFVPPTAGEDQRVEFVLYKMGEAEPLHILHLWVSVPEK